VVPFRSFLPRSKSPRLPPSEFKPVRVSRDQAPKHVMIDNLCYMLVNNSPREAIAVQFDYKLDEAGVLRQTQIDDNDWRPELWASDLKWVEYMFEDFADG